MQEADGQTLPTIADVRLAAERLKGRAVRTPLISSATLDERAGARLLVKCENLQRTGSFKFRGAYNAMAAMDHAARGAGVVAVSSGNHALGVTEAARLFGVHATIVMPTDAPAVKRRGVTAGGGYIVDYDRASQDRDEVAAAHMAAHGGRLVHPFEDPEVIAGQGTVGLEIVAECAARGVEPDVVVVPCGGGGLSAGIGIAVCDAFPAAAMVLVEPEGFDDYRRSLSEGGVAVNARQSGSICDSLLSPSPGRWGLALNRRHKATAITVSDAAALAAVAYAMRALKLVAEPSGAVALGALIAGRTDFVGRTVVAVVSGGNIDDELMAQALAVPNSG